MGRSKVSVIIPVYNVEQFVGKCSSSLFSQSLEDIEFIFVDDCTPDSSIDVIKNTLNNYPDRIPQCIFLKHDINSGLPAARNTGLSVAQGEYIYHCDSDDWVEPSMLEEMYSEAVRSGADIVYCDYFLSFEKNERYIHNPSYSSAEDLLRRGYLKGAAKYNVWNKLVKTSLYTTTGITFPEGHSMGEDMTMIMLTANAKSVAYVPKAFYHYIKLNAGAYTNTFKPRHLIDIKYNTDRVLNYLSKLDLDVSEDINVFKLNVKLPFLFTEDKSLYQIWKEWYPEANSSIMDNKEQALRTRLIQKAAALNQFWLVSLYYALVFKFIYGIIYK